MADAAATAALLAQITRAITDLANAQAAAANAAAAAVPIGGPPPPPVAPVAAVFALWPGLANNAWLDYNTADGRKIYNQAVSPLASQYDRSADGLQTFLAKVSARSREFNWDDIMNIPDSSTPPVPRSLIDAYGAVTLADCRAHAATYISTPSRIAQDSGMMFMILQASLKDEANSLILINPSEYTVNGQPSGPCFLKVIIGKATVDTIATVNVLRNSISNLVSKMTEYNSNIKLFNNHVTYLKNSLTSRMEDVPELMMNLFKGYASAADDDFVRYIQNKKDAYEDGTKMTTDQLMSSALNKYELKIEDNTWSVPDRKDDRIIALEAENAALKAGGKKRAKKLTSRSPSDQQFAWKKNPPKSGDPTTKKVTGKTYHWCVKHLAWTIHTPESCRLGEEKESPPEEKKLSMTKSLKAVEMEDSDEDEED
jgi:hypothetical protein